jgi:hypothetical protein
LLYLSRKEERKKKEKKKKQNERKAMETTDNNGIVAWTEADEEEPKLEPEKEREENELSKKENAEEVAKEKDEGDEKGEASDDGVELNDELRESSSGAVPMQEMTSEPIRPEFPASWCGVVGGPRELSQVEWTQMLVERNNQGMVNTELPIYYFECCCEGFAGMAIVCGYGLGFLSNNVVGFFHPWVAINYDLDEESFDFVYASSVPLPHSYTLSFSSVADRKLYVSYFPQPATALPPPPPSSSLSVVPENDALFEFLALHRCEAYYHRLTAFGVQHVDDMRELTDEDLISMQIKPLHRKRLKGALGNYAPPNEEQPLVAAEEAVLPEVLLPEQHVGEIGPQLKHHRKFVMSLWIFYAVFAAVATAMLGAFLFFGTYFDSFNFPSGPEAATVLTVAVIVFLVGVFSFLQAPAVLQWLMVYFPAPQKEYMHLAWSGYILEFFVVGMGIGGMSLAFHKMFTTDFPPDPGYQYALYACGGATLVIIIVQFIFGLVPGCSRFGTGKKFRVILVFLFLFFWPNLAHLGFHFDSRVHSFRLVICHARLVCLSFFRDGSFSDARSRWSSSVGSRVS